MMLPTYFLALENEFLERNEDFSDYKIYFNQLLARAENSIHAEPGGEIGCSKRIRQYTLILRQAYLHRATRLFLGALTSILDNNPYSMALSIRGHYETTAAIGYIHRRLCSLKEGKISSKKVDLDILQLLLGSKDKSLQGIAQERNFPMNVKSIMSLLEHADESVSRKLLKSSGGENSFLKINYEFLSEFSHPNFHSTIASYELDKKAHRFDFMHTKRMFDAHFQIIGYLKISHIAFVGLFDDISNVLPGTQGSNKDCAQ